jgi:heme/copper-type cytochrome/quinol oxidase subunit 2
MPIAVRIVSEDKFKAWVEEAKKKYAETPGRPSVVAEVAAQ